MRSGVADKPPRNNKQYGFGVICKMLNYCTCLCVIIEHITAMEIFYSIASRKVEEQVLLTGMLA